MLVENYHQVGEVVIVRIIRSGNYAVKFEKNGVLAPNRFKTKDEACDFAHDLKIITNQ